MLDFEIGKFYNFIKKKILLHLHFNADKKIKKRAI